MGEHGSGQPDHGLGVFEPHRGGRVRHDEVRIQPRGFGQPLMAGAHGRQILGDHRIRGASPLGLVAQQAADETDVGRSVDKHTDVEQGDQPGRAQHMGALDDDDVRGPHRLASRLTSMVDEGIEGGHDVPPGLQLGEIADHQLMVARRHIVEVERGGIEVGQAGGVAIVGVLAQQHRRTVGQGRDQGLGERALA